MLIVKTFLCEFALAACKAVENLLSNQLIEDWLSFHARIRLYCCKQRQKLLYLKDIDMSISPIEKFIILIGDVALVTKIFLGKKANLVKFIWFVKYFFNVFAADLYLRKNVFQIHMPPSFLLWRIMGKRPFQKPLPKK